MAKTTWYVHGHGNKQSFPLMLPKFLPNILKINVNLINQETCFLNKIILSRPI